MTQDVQYEQGALVLERVELLDEGARIFFSCTLPAQYDGTYELKLICGVRRKRRCSAVLVDDFITPDGRSRFILFRSWLPPFVVDARVRLVCWSSTDRLKLSLVITRELFEHAIDRPFEVPVSLGPNAQDDLSHHERTCARRAQEPCAVKPEPSDPLISIITPVFRPNPAFLREALESVLQQSYPRFEHIVVNVSGDCPEVDEVLASYSDERIKLIVAENRSISENTNVGIEAATGDYLAFIDHDDFIERDTLERYVEAIRKQSNADLLFCNEDVFGNIDGEQRFFGPKYKPGFNLDLLMTHNYLCHMLMVSRRVIERSELSGPECAAAQDYDLSFKAAECAREICCIPHMLYHWREHELSTATHRESKPYALEAGRRAVQAYLDRRRIAASVAEGSFPFSYRVHYAEPNPAPHVSFIIPEPHNPEALITLIELLQESVASCHVSGFEFVVASPRHRRAFSRRYRQQLVSMGARICDCARLTKHGQRVNAAVKSAQGEFCVLLDEACTHFADGWLDELIGPFSRSELGCTAPMLLGRDGRIAAHGCILRPDASLGFAERGLPPHDRGYMTMPLHARDCHVVYEIGMCFRREDFLALGGFHEDLDKAAFMSYCLQLAEHDKLSLSIPYAPITHVYNNALVFPEVERKLLLKLWPHIKDGDCYLDPALDPMSDVFALRKDF